MSETRTRGPVGVFGFASYLASEHDCGECARPAYHLIHDGEEDLWVCSDCACFYFAAIIAELREGRGR